MPRDLKLQKRIVGTIADLHKLLRADKFEEVEEFLRDFDVENEPSPMIHAVLVTTRPVYDYLPERKKLLGKAYEVLTERKNRKYAEEMLGGLEEY